MVMLGVVADHLLGATKLGDVGYAADDQARAVREVQRLLPGDDRPEFAAAVGDELLVLVRLAGLKDCEVYGPENCRLVGGYEVSVESTDELVKPMPHQPTHILVDD